MTHAEALAIFDRESNLFRAGVKIRVAKALRFRNADMWNSDDEGRKAIIAAEMIKAVEAERRGDKLP